MPMMPDLPLQQLIVTAVVLVALPLGRWLLERTVRRGEEFISDERRRFLSNAKNALYLVAVVALLMVWAPALRTVALSLAAFTVAIVLATKELILCLTGGLLHSGTSAFRVGDWVQVGDIHGQVIDQGFLTVTVQEIDSRSYEFTGRTITIPNSVFLTTAARKENFFKRYVYHRFHLILEPDRDPEPVEAAVRQSLAESMREHEEVARRYNALIERAAGLDMMGIEPQVALEMTNEGRLRMTVVAFMPTKRAVEFEQRAVRAALPLISAHAHRRSAERPAAAAMG